MIPIAAGSSISTFAAVVLAGVLMVAASVSRKRLRWRGVECQVCQHPRALCNADGARPSVTLRRLRGECRVE
jgi:hypothetical protein